MRMMISNTHNFKLSPFRRNIFEHHSYNRQTASNIWFGQEASGGQKQKFIPSTACYTAMALGVAWLANGIAAMFCTGGAFGKGGEYEAASYR
jgi:hypothetical protein